MKHIMFAAALLLSVTVKSQAPAFISDSLAHIAAIQAEKYCGIDLLFF
jgi:hypothetical protein